MTSPSKATRRHARALERDIATTRRAVLAAGGALTLGSLAGCMAVDEVVDRAGQEAIGTTAASPAAFYPGNPTAIDTIDPDSDDDGISDAEETDDGALALYPSGPFDIREVSGSLRTDARSIDIEGWAMSSSTKAQDYNSSRSNKPRSEWWDDDSDGDGIPDFLVAIQDIEIDLLGHVRTGRDGIRRREQESAMAGIEAARRAIRTDLRPALEQCETGVCETIGEHADLRASQLEEARAALEAGNWEQAGDHLGAVEDLILGDIERLDDALAEDRPDRPRFSELIAYLDDEPTLGERFTVCLPDAKLPGDRGSLAEELTLDTVLAYFAPAEEGGDQRPPFSDRYPTTGISYGEDGCLDLDGPVSLHRDVACRNILSASLNTANTGDRAIVGHGTEGGAVVSAASGASSAIGKRVFLATNDVTGEIILGEDRDMVMPGNNDSGSATLVCPVTVTPADCSCPLPGLFYVRRVPHDDQLIFAGGWILDAGALFVDSVTYLFDGGPTEVASVDPGDLDGDGYDDLLFEQFSGDRATFGGMVGVGHPKTAGTVGPIKWMAPESLRAGDGRKGLNAVNVKVISAQDGGDGGPNHTSATALDAPLVHLDGAGELSAEQKRAHGRKIVREVGAKK